LIVTRVVLSLVLAAGLWAQQKEQKEQKPVEPPEEDETLKVKEYDFNPLQAEKELTVGNFNFKRGNFRGAAMRFQEATKWNPGYAEAYIRWAEALEKMKDTKKAREVWAKFLEVAPDHKRAPEIKKKLGGKS
jgi:tetratricopeptide (TPR) repeat protein